MSNRVIRSSNDTAPIAVSVTTSIGDRSRLPIGAVVGCRVVSLKEGRGKTLTWVFAALGFVVGLLVYDRRLVLVGASGLS